jgi:glycosyltransferase involved in cell wall biosynthesis
VRETEVISRKYALIIPALNEAEAIGLLLRQIPSSLFSQIIVVDNGSADQTGAVARDAGAEVISEPRRGYGRRAPARWSLSMPTFPMTRWI